MEITYFGHSCFLVHVGEKKLLFDPFITANPLAAQVDIHAIEADYILISHGHEDHMLDAEMIGKKNNAKIIATYEVVEWFAKKGMEGHGMNTGGSWKFDFGLVKLVTAIHSSMLPDGSYGGNPAGFVVETNEGNIYFAGDTALTLDMQLIPVRTQLDIAFLPIGSNFTMDYTDAAQAAEFIQCSRIIGMHYDSFGFIKIDHEAAKKEFNEKGLELILMKIEEKISI